MPVKNMPELKRLLVQLRTSCEGQAMYQELISASIDLLREVRNAARSQSDTHIIHGSDTGLRLQTLKLQACEIIPELREGWDSQKAISTALELEEIVSKT